MQSYIVLTKSFLTTPRLLGHLLQNATYDYDIKSEALYQAQSAFLPSRMSLRRRKSKNRRGRGGKFFNKTRRNDAVFDNQQIITHIRETATEGIVANARRYFLSRHSDKGASASRLLIHAFDRKGTVMFQIGERIGVLRDDRVQPFGAVRVGCQQIVHIVNGDDRLGTVLA